MYRVTHLVDSNLSLTSKQKFRVGLACPDLTGHLSSFCRFERDNFARLVEIWRPHITRGNGRGPHPLTVSQQLGTALAYYRTGSFQQVAARIIGIRRSTANKTINRVSRIIASRKSDFIALPTRDEMRELSDEHFEEYGLPGIVP